jgi:hypothetical protein
VKNSNHAHLPFPNTASAVASIAGLIWCRTAYVYWFSVNARNNPSAHSDVVVYWKYAAYVIIVLLYRTSQKPVSPFPSEARQLGGRVWVACV